MPRKPGRPRAAPELRPLRSQAGGPADPSILGGVTVEQFNLRAFIHPPPGPPGSGAASPGPEPAAPPSHVTQPTGAAENIVDGEVALGDPADPAYDPWALADRERTREEAACGHFHLIVAHRGSGGIRSFPTACFKPSCPKCSARVHRIWTESLGAAWSNLDRVWVVEIELMTKRDWERIDKRRKRAARPLPNFLRVEMSDASAWILSDHDLGEPGGWWVSSAGSLDLVSALLSRRDPDPVVVRKPASSRPWRLPEARPDPTGDYRRLYDGCPERLRDRVREKAESVVAATYGVNLDLSEHGAIPPALIDDVKRIISEIIAEEVAWD